MSSSPHSISSSTSPSDSNLNSFSPSSASSNSNSFPSTTSSPVSSFPQFSPAARAHAYANEAEQWTSLGDYDRAGRAHALASEHYGLAMQLATDPEVLSTLSLLHRTHLHKSKPSWSMSSKSTGTTTTSTSSSSSSSKKKNKRTSTTSTTLFPELDQSYFVLTLPQFSKNEKYPSYSNLNKIGSSQNSTSHTTSRTTTNSHNLNLDPTTSLNNHHSTQVSMKQSIFETPSMTSVTFWDMVDSFVLQLSQFSPPPTSSSSFESTTTHPEPSSLPISVLPTTLPASSFPSMLRTSEKLQESYFLVPRTSSTSQLSSFLNSFNKKQTHPSSSSSSSSSSSPLCFESPLNLNLVSNANTNANERSTQETKEKKDQDQQQEGPTPDFVSLTATTISTTSSTSSSSSLTRSTATTSLTTPTSETSSFLSSQPSSDLLTDSPNHGSVNEKQDEQEEEVEDDNNDNEDEEEVVQKENETSNETQALRDRVTELEGFVTRLMEAHMTETSSLRADVIRLSAQLAVQTDTLERYKAMFAKHSLTYSTDSDEFTTVHDPIHTVTTTSMTTMTTTTPILTPTTNVDTHPPPDSLMMTASSYILPLPVTNTTLSNCFNTTTSPISLTTSSTNITTTTLSSNGDLSDKDENVIITPPFQMIS